MTFAPKYTKELQKLLSYRVITQEQVDETIELFKINPKDSKIRPHKITCKHDKERRSISIINTQYRILYTKKDGEVMFVHIVDHDTYDRLNKDC